MPKTAKSSEAMKSTLYQHIARVAAALASESRLALLEYVAQGERSVETLANMTGLSMANCSKHLQALRAAGLVHARKEGLRVYYGLAGDDVVALYSALHHVAENRVAEVEKLVRTWLRHKDEMEPVPPAELLDRVAKGLVVVIDVRPPEEYAAGHVPGAINVPIDQLESRLAKFWVTTMMAAWNRCAISFRMRITVIARSLSSGAVGSSARMIGALVDQRPRDRHALLLAARKLRHLRLRAVADVERSQHRPRLLARLRVGHAGEHRQQRDIVGDIEERDEVRRLEHEADAVAAQRPQVGDLPAVVVDRLARRAPCGPPWARSRRRGT